MDTETPQDGSRKSGADRARLHRERKKVRETQVAVGVAKLVLGQGPGEQRNAIMELLERSCEIEDMPDEYRRSIERALERLSARRSF